MIRLPQLLLVAVAVLGIKFLPFFLLPVAVAVLYAWINWGRAVAAINRNPASSRVYAALREPANAMGEKALDLMAVKKVGDKEDSPRIEKPLYIPRDPKE